MNKDREFPLPKRIIFPAALIIASILVYANSLNNGFVWDDSLIIVNNPANRDMSVGVRLFRMPDTTHSDAQMPYYRPLNRLTYMLDYRLYGLKPLYYHLENVLLHITAVLLLFMLVNNLFSNALTAFLSALLFAVHPLNSEAVNFISGGRNTILAAVFALSSFIVFARGVRKQRMRYVHLAGFIFFLSLLCKESAVVLPLILFLFLYKSGPTESSGTHIKQKIFFLMPFVLFSVLYVYMRAQALPTVIGTGFNFSGLWSRMAKDFYIVPKYLSLFAFPANLTIYYPTPEDYLGRTWLLAAWAVILLSLFWLFKKKNEGAIFGAAWFALNFIPVANIVPIPSSPIAERYMYLPVMGLCVITADFFCRVVRLGPTKALRWIFILAMIMIFPAMAFVSAMRNLDWKDDLSLFGSVTRSLPNSVSGHYNLGCAFRDRGDLISAKREWERTLEIEPQHSHALNQLGSVYYISNFPLRAQEYFSRAVLADPGNSQAHYNLAITLESLNKPDEALTHYKMFLKRVPPEYYAVAPEVEKKIDVLSRRGKR